MQGLSLWSLPFTRIAGITVRIHLFFLLYIAAEVIRNGQQYGGAVALEAFLMMVMLFAIVLLHELGHCFAARSVGGSADDILLWPLGGLAFVHHPPNPRAAAITTACGPAVNLGLFLLAGVVLLLMGYWAPLNPLWSSFAGRLDPVGGLEPVGVQVLPWYVMWTARFFFLNWMLFWFNVLCVGFPLDGGRLLQAALWARMGYVAATRIACYCGIGVSVLLVLGCYWLGKENFESVILMMTLSFWIFFTCYTELQQLEMGGVDEDPFGYDFSQGYTSLERSARARERRPSLLHRWRAGRAERRRKREEEQRQAEEERMDALLVKVKECGGLGALTAEEQRFMRRVGEKLRQKRRND